MQDFTLEPLMAALDLVEFTNSSVEQVLGFLRLSRGSLGSRARKQAHDGLIAWTVDAVDNYLKARHEYAQQDNAWPTTPIRYTWVARRPLSKVDHRGADYYEQTSWGRRFASAEGDLREIWLPSFGAPREDRAEAELAAAAYAVALGQPCAPAYDGRHEPIEDLEPAAYVLPQRIRVVEFGCGTGGFKVFEWDRDAVLTRFEAIAAPVLSSAISGSTRSPGRDCVDCKIIAGCDAIRRAELLPDLPPTVRRRPSVSASDLRAHNACPASYHLTRQLKLRRHDRPEKPAVLRGRAVDDWLTDRHSRIPLHCCDVDDVPDSLEEWTDGQFTVHGAEAVAGAKMLRQHTLFCPVGESGDQAEMRVQRTVAVYDPGLDLVFVATPDLLYERSGGWVWRETKTAGVDWRSGSSLLGNYPQVALAVLMVAAGVLDGPVERSRIELEVLYSDDCSLEQIDPNQDEVVAEARAVVGDLLKPFLIDTTFSSTPGRDCFDCSVVDWCAPGSRHVSTMEVIRA